MATRRQSTSKKTEPVAYFKRMKRILVKDDDYFTQLILYIHHNPIHHKFVQEYADWEFSSYRIISGDLETFNRRAEVLDWFGGKDEFIEFHWLNRKLILKPEQIY